MNILQNLVERLNTILDKDFGPAYSDPDLQEAFEDGIESMKNYVELALEIMDAEIEGELS